MVAPEDVDSFLQLAHRENLSATPVARVTDDNRLRMTWNGAEIVNVSREFLNSNGAEKHIRIKTQAPLPPDQPASDKTFSERYTALAGDLNICSKRGLAERFDSTIGAGTVLMPFGGRNQLTPAQAMVQKISMEKKHTDDCSLMAFGYNPFLSEKNPYQGAYLAVVESVCKLIASGADFKKVYLTFQEYFKHPGKDGARWGEPAAALLGAFKAQMELGIGAIGGKDSMSGSFEKLDVPPTLVSFAVTTSKVGNIVSPEFKAAGHNVILLRAAYDENGLPVTESLLAVFRTVSDLLHSGKAVACYTPGMGGIAAAVMKMCFGNGIGFRYADGIGTDEIFGNSYASFLLEMADGTEDCPLLGTTTEAPEITHGAETVPLAALLTVYEDKLESVFPCNIRNRAPKPETLSYHATGRCAPAIRAAKPRVLIPVFPGTNCEYDSAKAVADAGAIPEIAVIRNLSADDIAASVSEFAAKLKQAQIVFLPGGFSGGDEPDGSGKFITAFFRNPEIREEVTNLLERRDGLMCGICNGFQALIKLGLVPFGKIVEPDASNPTLTYNTIARHQSRIVRTRIVSNKSPWLSLMEVGEIVNVPISHGEGRFYADDAWLARLAANGQIATQYADFDGNATNDIRFNPNDSAGAVEGITSPDGRVFGKMGHSERIGNGLYRNVPGNYDEVRMWLNPQSRYFKS